MSKELALRGHVETLILALLAGKDGSGAQLHDRLAAISGGLFDLPAGTLYPALHRLQSRGLIEGDDQTVDGRRQRLYAITRSGKQVLKEQKLLWRETVAAMDAVLETHGRTKD